MNLQIEPYTSSDQTAVLALHEAALKPTGAFIMDPELDADLFHIQAIYLDNGGEFLVGKIEDKIVAMGAIKKVDANTCELKRMRVDPEYQRQGFGQQMLVALEQRAKQLGYAKITLDTGVIQAAARKLYEANGYQETGQGKIQNLEVIYFAKQL